MIAVIPFHSADYRAVLDLLHWIQLLGGCPRQSCLLVADADTQWGTALDILDLANKVFRSATIITNDRPVKGWVEGSNSLFLAAALHIEEGAKTNEYPKVGEPWLWLEPDCVPLKSGWLDRIQFVYNQCTKPFMGQLYRFDNPPPANGQAPFTLLSGIAVYPPDAWSKMAKAMKFAPNLAFDVAAAPVTVPLAAHTNLIQHFYGELNLPPTFAESKTEQSPRNTFTLDRLHPEAMLFHRNKDGTLMKLLHKKLFPAEHQRFVVILPFCNRDGGMMLKNLKWMERLGGCKNDTCVVAYDRSTRPEIIASIQAQAHLVFGKVMDFVYGTPKRTDITGAAKHAFRCVSGFMRSVNKPWLWFEADMVPLKRGWLDGLQAAYTRGGKPFFGPVVPGMGHFNGTAVYPPNTFSICPSLQIENNDAWDTAMRDETRGKVFDASAYIQHAWTMANGRLQPHGSGDYPIFRTADEVRRMILPTALTFHRDKSLSLIDRLTEMGVA